MKIVLEANYRLPSGKPMASRVADIFSLQKREVLAYVRSGRTTPINLNGWINYTTDKLLPFYLYHVAQGWKTHGDRLNQKLPKRKAMLHGLFVKGDRKKKKDEDDKKKYALLGLLALMNPDIIDATRMVARQYIIGMLNTSAKRVNGILAKMREIEATGGQPLMMGDVVEAITNVFENKARLDTIGDTESSRAYHIGAIQVLENTRMQWMKTWWTARDEKVCFPAGTLIDSQNGQIAIEAIRPGMMVKTRLGFKKVLATSCRQYSGKMVLVKAGGCQVVSTADHPFWTLEHGWLPGDELLPGYSLYSSSNEFIKINSISDFNLAKSDEFVSPAFEESIFPGVTSLVSVPVNAVRFDSESETFDQKINAIPSDFGLLDVLDAKAIKGLADGLFQSCLGCAAAVARSGAEAWIICRDKAKYLAAMIARSFMGRSVAFFRAMRPSACSIVDLECREFLATPFAVSDDPCGKTAGHAAIMETMSDCFIDDERFSTRTANLFDFWSRCLQALSGAELVLGYSCPVIGQVEFYPASKAVFVNSATLALRHGELEFLESDRHDESYRDLCARTIPVYNLEVEGCPEYFANGVLVHNCPVCRPLHGVTIPINQTFISIPESGSYKGINNLLNAPPAHPGTCRCKLSFSTELVVSPKRQLIGV